MLGELAFDKGMAPNNKITERDRIRHRYTRKIKLVRYKQLGNPVMMLDMVRSGDQFRKYVTTHKQINFMSMCVCV